MIGSQKLHTMGVYGGTFDPVHKGHIQPVLQAAEQAGFDHVKLIPCHIPPHKGKPRALPAQRLEMLELICAEFSCFSIDERELKKGTPSYTVETLQELRTQIPDSSIAFFMGMDSFANLNKWYKWQELLDLSHIVVCERSDQVDQLPQEIGIYYQQHGTQESADLHTSTCGKIFIANTQDVQVSSSLIRKRIKDNESYREFVPDSIYQYIQRCKLYQSD